MHKLLFVLLLGIFSMSLNACAGLTTDKPNLIAVYMGIADKPCAEVVSSTLIRLDELELPFVWLDESKQLFSVGPIIEHADAGSKFSKIEQTYYLEIICDEESMTRIINKISLKGLSSDGKWIEITDIPTIKEYGSQFLYALFL